MAFFNALAGRVSLSEHAWEWRSHGYEYGFGYEPQGGDPGETLLSDHTHLVGIGACEPDDAEPDFGQREMTRQLREAIDNAWVPEASFGPHNFNRANEQGSNYHWAVYFTAEVQYEDGESLKEWSEKVRREVDDKGAEEARVKKYNRNWYAND